MMFGVRSMKRFPSRPLAVNRKKRELQARMEWNRTKLYLLLLAVMLVAVFLFELMQASRSPIEP